MGTLLKYLLYALIIVVIYLIGVGFYEGRFNRNSTIGEVSENVAQGTKEIIKDGYNSTKSAVSNGYDSAKRAINENQTINTMQEGVADGYDATVDTISETYEDITAPAPQSNGGFQPSNNTQNTSVNGGFQAN